MGGGVVVFHSESRLIWARFKLISGPVSFPSVSSRLIFCEVWARANLLITCDGIYPDDFVREQVEQISIEDVEEFMVDLRSMARQLLRGEQDAYSVQPTALVISALRRQKGVHREWDELTWGNQREFFIFMEVEMRRSLTDHARRRNALKRPRLAFIEPKELDFYDLSGMASDRPEVMIALEEALARLSEERPELADIIRYHYFLGTTVIEAARFLGYSEATAKRRLIEARLLLSQKIIKIVNGDG